MATATSETMVTPSLMGSITPPVVPLEVPPIPAATPPSSGSLVRIWVAWGQDQILALNYVIDSFQDIYPTIRFQVFNFPQEDLRRRYEVAAYNGGGPGLLLAPAEWGPAFYESDLVSDLSSFTSPEFLARINPGALGTGQYTGGLISLPLSQEGVVLLRNKSLIPTAAETFDELITAARAATRAGNLGAYFDRGAFYSAGNLAGLGGVLMNDDQSPAFNSPVGISWLNLLEAYDVAGAVGDNTDRDLELFRNGRIGYIIDGTWQVDTLVQTVGEENLVIDPWPQFNSGHLSGFIRAEAMYLNPNINYTDAYATMLFMGYLLTPDVQQYLAETGMIPVALDANPRRTWIAQAAHALEGGTAYPPVADPHVITVYWEGLEMAIQSVFNQMVDPDEALLDAQNLVQERLSELNP